MTGSLIGDIITVVSVAGILWELWRIWRERRVRVVYVADRRMDHPNCRCSMQGILSKEVTMAPTGKPDPRLLNPNGSAWMHSGPDGTIDLDAIPVKK